MPHPVQLSSPFPAEDLLFESMSATSGLGTLGETRLNMLSRKQDLKIDDILGKPVTVTMALPDDAERHFHGFVTRFAMTGARGGFYAYQATVRPWLWLLTRTADCRIFQDLSVPDIVAKVFEDHSIANFEFKLFRSYRTWNYCVQYRESDFAFVSRLLESEGIYYYFEHAQGRHKMVLVDSSAAHDPGTRCATLPYYSNASQVPPDQEFVSRWSVARDVQPGKVVITDYDFERPSTSLKVEATKTRAYDLSDHEVFDYPGEYVQKADGQQYDDTRLDELQARHETINGVCNAQDLCTGKLFKLERHPREDQNAEYLVVSTQVECHADGYESGSAAATSFSCSFVVMPSAQQFRPRRATQKPVVNGSQTAVVVGPSGEEIYTDKYGRVKVQFHWDRYGQKDEKSSCWVRVSHPWAGKNFGAIHIPRIGQEVIVGFLEGDPDQPIITGRVYNAEQMPPWDLPANATQSGILTRSSKGGGYGNANAIRFEDKAGSEQLWIHAEKNQDIEVENDETHWVGHDRTKTIDNDETVHVKHDRTETVDNNETITIGVDRKEQVGSNETIDIGSNRTETVGSNETITIGVDRTESVGSNESITIGSNRSVTIGASKTETVALQRTRAVGVNESVAIGAAQEIAIGAGQSVTVGADQTVSVGANQSTSVGSNQTVDVGSGLSTTVGADEEHKVGGSRNASVGKNESLKVAEKMAVSVGDSLTLACGDASIILKKDGTIQIKGKNITITGSGKITAKADGDMVLKGSKIAQN